MYRQEGKKKQGVYEMDIRERGKEWEARGGWGDYFLYLWYNSNHAAL